VGSIAKLERIYDSASLRAWLLEDHLVTAQFPEPELQVWNPTASAIWLLLLDGKYDLKALTLQIGELFGISLPHLEAELNACLSNWIQRQWIQFDERGKYFISPKISGPALPIRYTDAPKKSKVSFDKTYCINGNQFRLRVRVGEDSQSHPFLTRITAIAQGFLELASDPQFQLDIVIDSDFIYVREGSQGYLPFLDSAEALNHCIQYFLKISAGESIHFSTLHAAALGLESSLLLSGVSGAGKSTLCALRSKRGPYCTQTKAGNIKWGFTNKP
jgi:hypothetical protein